MKKHVTKIISLLLAIIMCVSSPLVVYAAQGKDNFADVYKEYFVNNRIPEEAVAQAEESFQDIIYVTDEYYDSIDIKNLGEYYMGVPFIIYNDSEEALDEVYHFPVIFKDEVVLIISVINTTEGWSVSASDENCALLNENGYATDSNCLIYVENEEIHIRKPENISKEGQSEFAEQSYIACLQDVSNRLSEMEPVNIESIYENAKSNGKEEGYAPAFSIDTMKGAAGSRRCALYNEQAQGSLPICWAASVATVVNYRKGTNYTAKDVCDKMKTGYKGAGIDKKKEALSKYNVDYEITEKQLSWVYILQNIDKKYPIIISAFTSANDGHSTVVYGYTVTSSNKYITMYNHGTDRTVTLQYKPSGTTFVYNSKTWTWTKSLSYYYMEEEDDN